MFGTDPEDGEEKHPRGSIGVSGTIETTEVLVSPELSGRIVEVYVRKGEFVQAGDPLMRLDDEILLAQREGRKLPWRQPRRIWMPPKRVWHFPKRL